MSAILVTALSALVPVAPAQPFADLHQGMLRLSWLSGGIVEVFVDVAVGELAAEPGGIPEQERKQNQQEGE